MNSIADQMLTIYVFVADFLTQHPSLANWRRSNNDQPEFTDAKVITVGLLQGCFGVATFKQTYRLVKTTFGMPSRCCPVMPSGFGVCIHSRF